MSRIGSLIVMLLNKFKTPIICACCQAAPHVSSSIKDHYTSSDVDMCPVYHVTAAVYQPIS
jgi:hypothetical protein